MLFHIKTNFFYLFRIFLFLIYFILIFIFQMMRVFETITNFHIAFLTLLMLSSTICILNNTTQALSSLLPILDFSVGNSHLTVMYGSTPGTLNVQQIRMHNMVTGGSFLINSSRSGARQLIREPPGNNESSFMYILNYNNFWEILAYNSTRNYFLATAMYKFNVYFSFIPNILNGFFLTTTQCVWYTLTANNSEMFVLNYVDYSCKDSEAHSSGIVFNFLLSNTNYTGLVSVHNQTSYATLYSQYYPQSSPSTNFYGQVSQLYYCVVLNNTFTIKTIALRSLICNVSVAEQIYDAKITDEYVFISISSAIKQYNITSCSQIGNFTTTGVAILRVHVAPINILYYMYPNTSTIYRLNFSETPASTPTPTTPPSAPSVQTRSGIQYITCDFSCQTCSISSDICDTCKINRSKGEDGRCYFSAPTQAIVASANSANTFRFGSVQSILCILDGIQKYKYHKTNYSGLIQQIIKQMNDMSSLKWNLISIQAINQWMQSSDGTDYYQFFTNSKFLSVQRSNALIFQTTKAFYSISIPFNLLIFVMLNRLFRLLKGYKISSAIRQFSFGLQFFMIVVISNSNTISFLAIHYFSVLFSLTYAYKLLHALSLVAIGIFLLILLTFFFMSAYFYGKLSKYFLPNLYRMNCAYFYSFVKFSLQPLIQSALHFFLYENGELQLICLACFEGCFFFLQVAVQLNYEVFKSKLTFICESCLQFSMALLNIFLLLSYYKLKQDNQIVQIVDLCIQTLCFCMFGVICLAFLQLLLMVVINLLFRKKKTDDIWNWGERVKQQKKKRTHLLRNRRKQMQQQQQRKNEKIYEEEQQKRREQGQERTQVKAVSDSKKLKKTMHLIKSNNVQSGNEKVQNQKLQKKLETEKKLKLNTKNQLISSYHDRSKSQNSKQKQEGESKQTQKLKEVDKQRKGQDKKYKTKVIFRLQKKSEQVCQEKREN